jgi:hypothetical protein
MRGVKGFNSSPIQIRKLLTKRESLSLPLGQGEALSFSLYYHPPLRTERGGDIISYP